MSLRHSYSYSLTGQAGLTISKETVISLKHKVSRWSSSFHQNCTKRHWKKMEEDFHALITPDKIKQFETSKAARDVVSLPGQLSSAHNIQITQTLYTLFRDFLLVKMSIDKANRADALVNMSHGIQQNGQRKWQICQSCKESQDSEHPWSLQNCFLCKIKTWMDIFLK